MSTRRPLISSALAVLLSTGCGRGPSDQALCAAIVAALPVLFVITLSVLFLLEQIRRAPDRGEGSLGRRSMATTGVLLALSALACALGARPDLDTVILVLMLFGALAVGVALALWRVRASATYASRVLRAAQLGVALGLPALVLWAPGLDSIAERYIQGLAVASFVGGLYITPLLLLGLFIESIIRSGSPRR